MMAILLSSRLPPLLIFLPFYRYNCPHFCDGVLFFPLFPFSHKLVGLYEIHSFIDLFTQLSDIYRDVSDIIPRWVYGNEQNRQGPAL